MKDELAQAAHGDNPDKVAAALARFTVEEVADPAAFELGYRLLEAQFGPVNEIERHEILERWSREGCLAPEGSEGMRPHYHMLLFRDRDGRLVADYTFDPAEMRPDPDGDGEPDRERKWRLIYVEAGRCRVAVVVCTDLDDKPLLTSVLDTLRTSPNLLVGGPR